MSSIKELLQSLEESRLRVPGWDGTTGDDREARFILDNRVAIVAALRRLKALEEASRQVLDAIDEITMDEPNPDDNPLIGARVLLRAALTGRGDSK